MSLLLALQGGGPPPDITGSGASSIDFADAGTALLVFEGSGASVVGLVDEGVGTVLLDIFGTGASLVTFTDEGAGAVEGAVKFGGGLIHRQRLLRPPLPKRKPEPTRRPEPKRPSEVFAYVSESNIVFASEGRGRVAQLVKAHGQSYIAFASAGAGRTEESAADIIRLLLLLDEV